jgi:hypothetical protein
MSIVFIHAAVLRDLGTGSEDDPGVHFEKDVRSALVLDWAIELVGHCMVAQRSLCGKILPCHSFPVGYDDNLHVFGKCDQLLDWIARFSQRP